MIETADEQHEISMYDIVSLYPYCNFNGPYPLGHPTIERPEEANVLWTKPEDVNYTGILKVNQVIEFI
jgi:hypothetical protein